MEIGAEWLVDATGCRSDALVNLSLLRDLFDRVICDLDLHPLHEPVWHAFPPPGGVTGFVVLTESHLACHTYPEHGVLTVNLYCCRPRPDWPWRERLREMFGATNVEVRSVERLKELVPWQ
ncbi:MAG TPA: S-adenosylmethionine decarboxylase [Thermoanaerobaculia bacterium]|nr:S-adenosylmethionine decarboxylase [Thermoanaerobaculia bacterium]